MSRQKLKGLWIPAEILLNNDLSDKEKIILSMILYLSDETGSCFASNKYIASIVNVTSDRVSKIVTRPVRNGCRTGLSKEIDSWLSKALIKTLNSNNLIKSSIFFVEIKIS